MVGPLSLENSTIVVQAGSPVKNRDEARRWFEKCVETDLVLDPDVGGIDAMNEYEKYPDKLSYVT